MINELDADIKPLVEVLNNIPFIKTIESCSGHLTNSLIAYNPVTKKNILLVAYNGYKLIRYGALSFNCDPNYENNKLFMMDLKMLIGKYYFSKLHDSRRHKIIFLNTSDITYESRIKREDSFINAALKTVQVKEDEGIERMNEFKKFWNEMFKISKKYT